MRSQRTSRGCQTRFGVHIPSTGKSQYPVSRAGGALPRTTGRSCGTSGASSPTGRSFSSASRRPVAFRERPSRASRAFPHSRIPITFGPSPRNCGPKRTKSAIPSVKPPQWRRFGAWKTGFRRFQPVKSVRCGPSCQPDAARCSPMPPLAAGTAGYHILRTGATPCCRGCSGPCHHVLRPGGAWSPCRRAPCRSCLAAEHHCRSHRSRPDGGASRQMASSGTNAARFAPCR
ncbi:hypothetical protein DSM100685_0704 [Bifidobacterium avesanii]|nr:hypothetical protein DSM100685_0704 [Bifidobacterium avesanii]